MSLSSNIPNINQITINDLQHDNLICDLEPKKREQNFSCAALFLSLRKLIVKIDIVIFTKMIVKIINALIMFYDQEIIRIDDN